MPTCVQCGHLDDVCCASGAMEEQKKRSCWRTLRKEEGLMLPIITSVTVSSVLNSGWTILPVEELMLNESTRTRCAAAARTRWHCQDILKQDSEDGKVARGHVQGVHQREPPLLLDRNVRENEAEIWLCQCHGQGMPRHDCNNPAADCNGSLGGRHDKDRQQHFGRCVSHT